MDRRTFVTTAAATLAMPRLALAADGPIKLRDLYNPDQSFSDLATSLEGKTITVDGFMAPPLKADTTFFVLTKRPMATCPFCESEADWPQDIVAIYTRRIITPVPFNVPIDVTGTLQLGTFKDEEFGFVSRVRMIDARFERA